MIRDYFHRWEQELAAVSKNDRKVRPFEWGEDWIQDRETGDGNRETGDGNRETGDGGRETGDGSREMNPAIVDPGSRIAAWVDDVMKDTDAFYTPAPVRYTFTAAPDTVRASGEHGVLTFPTGFTTPHESNNTVVARWFPSTMIILMVEHVSPKGVMRAVPTTRSPTRATCPSLRDHVISQSSLRCGQPAASESAKAPSRW